MSQRSLRYQDDKSDKFWTIVLSGCSHTVTYGRMGTAGQRQTKDFPTEDAALKSYEKLVAEKLKKGYGEDGAIAVPQEVKKTAKLIPAVTKVVDLSSATETVVPELKIERSLNLNPEDWFWATWRDRKPLVRPQAKPFDLDDALARLGQIAASNYGWSWDWSQANLAIAMSREEAHFWLLAMSRVHREIVAKDLVEQFAGKEFTGNILFEDFYKSLFNPVSNTSHIHVLTAQIIESEIILPLVNLFSIEQLAELLFRLEKQVANLSRNEIWVFRQLQKSLAIGFQEYIIPYLSESGFTMLQDIVRLQLDLNKWPQDYYQMPSYIFHLAAYLGFPELLSLIESWENDYYSHKDGRHDFYHCPQEIIFGLSNPELVQSHMRRLKLSLHLSDQHKKHGRYLRAWLAHTEFSALDYVGATISAMGNKKEAEINIREFLDCVQAPEVAPVMLDLMLSSKAPQIARKWLESNTSNAIAGLIPTAAGKGRLAEAAIDFLRSMKRKGYAAFISTCLEQESDEIAAKIKATILDLEEKEYIPFDAKTTPPWLQEASKSIAMTKKTSWNISPIDLPAIALNDHRFNDSQIELLLNALRQSKLDKPHDFIPSLKHHIDREILNNFAWKLFEQWLVEGTPSKENWAMTALGLLGNDTTALKLAPMIRVWPGESQHQRAVLGLECLRAIGTDTALMQINGIAQKVKFKGIKQRAQECMTMIAQDRNMTREELEDRIVPTCDLDDQGSRTFDFGDRQFRLVLSPELKPMLKGADGKAKPDLPKPNSKDNLEKAETAIADWKLLKKQISEVIKLQPIRLEQAMITGRRWSLIEFETLLVQHPLMIHLVQRLIWAGYDSEGNMIDTFRVTEDRSYADGHDESLKIEGFASVGIIHPLHLPEAVRSQWGEIFSDYEIISPFIQLGRSLHALESGEEQAKEITRFQGIKVPALALVGTLDKLAWARGLPQDAGIFYEHSKPFYSANVTAVVQYEGVPIGYMEGWEDQSIESCFFVDGIHGPQTYFDHRQGIQLGEIDSLVISEVLKDLYAIASKAK